MKKLMFFSITFVFFSLTEDVKSNSVHIFEDYYVLPNNNVSNIEAGVIYVGREKPGSLIINDNSYVTVDLGANIASKKSADNSLISVDGINAYFEVGASFFIGSTGIGKFEVKNGAKAKARYTNIGDGENSYGSLLVGNDKTIFSGTTMSVGVRGSGTAVFEDKSTTNISQSISIAEYDGSVGNLTINNPGTRVTANSVFIGQEGAGTLNIFSGGSIYIKNRAFLAMRNGSEGVLNIDGYNSNFTTDGKFTISDDINAIASMNISNGGVARINDAIFIDGDSESVVKLNISGDGSVLDSKIFNIENTSNLEINLSNNAIISSNRGAGDIFFNSECSCAKNYIYIGGKVASSPVKAGTIQAETVKFGAGTTTLNFNHVGETSFSASLVSVGPGAHAINHYSGVTTFTADNSEFKSTTNIYGGSLFLGTEDGNYGNLNVLGGKVNVLANGTLGGYGAFSGAVDIDGTLSVGDNGGSLVFLDQLNLKSTSKTIFNLNNMGSLNPNDNAQDMAVFVDKLNIDNGALEAKVAGAGIYFLFLYNSPDYGAGFTNPNIISTNPDFIAASSSVVYTMPQIIYLKVLGSGQTMQFWDGAKMSGSGNVEGGDGIWNASNTNWVDNFVITAHDVWGESVGVFAGRKGTVTVQGTQTFDTLNFLTDGYKIVEGELALKGTNGSTLNMPTSITATIGSKIVDGASSILNIVGSGTITLTNDNTYTGETRLIGGVLSVSKNANLGAPSAILRFNGGTLLASANMDLNRPVIFDNDNGAIAVSENHTLTALTPFTGSGGFIKRGAGILKIASPSTYFGETIIHNGTMTPVGENYLSQASAFTIEQDGTLALQDFNQTLSSLNNGGLIDMGVKPGTVLTISGDYMGNNGTILMRTVLGDDNSITDKLVINGNSEGFTTLAFENADGKGAFTKEGIKIVDVKGTSNGIFRLQGNYEHEGEQAVVIGAYAYKLYKNGVSNPSDGDWYLRSRKDDTPSPDPEPLYQAGGPLYEAYGQTLLAMNSLSSLQERVGNRIWAGNGNRTIAQGEASADTPYANIEEAGSYAQGNGVWGRIDGAHNHIKPHVSTTNSIYDQNIYQVQLGIDGMLKQTDTGRIIGGVNLQYASGEAKVYSASGYGTINTDAYRIGASLTYYHDEGYYADAQGQLSWYRSDLKSDLVAANLANDNHGMGYALSLEGGKRIALGNPSWSVTPQAQLIYSAISFDDFTDSFGSRIKLDRNASLQSRLGLALAYENAWQNGQGTTNRARIYGLGNLYYEFLNGTSVDLADASLASQNDRIWGGVGVGGTYNWNDDKYFIYGEGIYNTSFDSFAQTYTIKGHVGFRVKW